MTPSNRNDLRKARSGNMSRPGSLASNYAQWRSPILRGAVGRRSRPVLTGSPAERPYGHPDLGSHYHGQVDATESRYEGGPARS